MDATDDRPRRLSELTEENFEECRRRMRQRIVQTRFKVERLRLEAQDKLDAAEYWEEDIKNLELRLEVNERLSSGHPNPYEHGIP